MPGKITENTKSLISLMQSHGLSQHISVPTRRTSHTCTLLDVMYVKTEKVILPYIIKTTASDHYLTGCVRYLNYTKPEKVVVRGHSYRNYNRDKAEDYYSKYDLSRIYEMDNVDLIWDYLCKLITNCANVLCPFKDISVRIDKPSSNHHPQTTLIPWLKPRT